jgi:hypothetical protein
MCIREICYNENKKKGGRICEKQRLKKFDC